MTIERNWKTRLRYRSDELLSGGAGRQLLLLLGLVAVIVLLALYFLQIFLVQSVRDFAYTLR